MWPRLISLAFRSRTSSTSGRSRKTGHLSLTLEHLEERIVLSSTPSWTAIGPAPITGNTSDGGTVTGRVTATAADPNPSDTNGNTVYIGTAGGGVWMGQNIHSGTPTWTPLTDNLAAQTGDPLINLNLGAIATTWDPTTKSTVIYAGLGEANSESNLMTTSSGASQFYGAGIIESVNGGQTWTLLGGQGSSNIFYRSAISTIIIDPTNSDNIYVAVSTAKNGVVGNEGVWHSADGGQTWVNTTASQIVGSTVDMYSGLVMDPSNDQVLYAAVGEASGSAANGVYMTANGGTTWTKMANMPSGVGVGRITLALSANLSSSGAAQYELFAAFITDKVTQSATVTAYSQSGYTVTLYYSAFAGLENFKTGETVDVTGVGSGFDGTQTITSVSQSGGTIQFTVSAKATIPQTSASGSINTEMGGLYQLGYAVVGGVAGDTSAAWHVIPGFDLPTPKTSKGSSNSYNYVGNQGYYCTSLGIYTTTGSVTVYAGGQDSFLEIDKADSAKPVVTNLFVSGPTGIHVDHHAILLDPTGSSGSDPFTVLDGSDGGVWSWNPNAASGSRWTNLNTNLQISQFYGIAVNPTNTSEMYGGLQDNGNVRTLNAGATPWQAASNDDGSLVYIDSTTTPETVYFTHTGVLYKSIATSDPFAATTSLDFNANYSGNSFWAITPQPGPPGSSSTANSEGIGDWPGVTYLMEPVTVNGQQADYLWYGGGDSNGNGSLWLSTNGGTTWSLIGSPTLGTSGNGWVPSVQAYQNNFALDNTPVDSIGVDPNVPGTEYVGLRGGYLLTTTNGLTANGNASWTLSTPVPLLSTTILTYSAGTLTVANTAGFPHVGQLFVNTATGTVVLTYTGISGNSFTGVAGGAGYKLAAGDSVSFQNDLRFSDILVDPNNSQVAYVAAANFGDVTGGSHVLMTTNGGISWTNISGNLPDVPVWSIQQGIVSGQQTLFVGTDIGVYASSNGGATWAPYGANLPNVQARSMSLVPDSSDPSQSVLAVGTWGRGAYEIFIPVNPAPSPPSPPASPPAPSPLPSGYGQTAQSNLSAGASAASQNYQLLGTLDAYFAYFFAAQALSFANLANNTSPSSTLDWYLADVSAYYSLQYCAFDYSWSLSPFAAAAASYEYSGLVNGLFALFNP